MNLYDENNERKQCVEGQEKESIDNKTGFLVFWETLGDNCRFSVLKLLLSLKPIVHCIKILFPTSYLGSCRNGPGETK